MIYKYFFVFFTLLLASLNAVSLSYSDTINATLVDSIYLGEEVREINIDTYRDIYAIYEDEVIKYGPKGNKITNYSFPQVNSYTNVSFRSMGEMLIYFKDISTIVILDNQLTEKLRIESINNQLNRDIIKACFAFNNHFLLLDRLSNQLIKADKQLEISNSSPDIATLIAKRKLADEMIFANHFYYLLYKEEGIAQFDLFTAFVNYFQLDNIDLFCVFEDLIFYTNKQGELFCYNINSLSTALISFKDKFSKMRIKSIKCKSNTLFLLQDNGYVEKYSIDFKQL